MMHEVRTRIDATLDEIDEWCDVECKGRWVHYDHWYDTTGEIVGVKYQFSDPNDAMRFKLTFGAV